MNEEQYLIWKKSGFKLDICYYYYLEKRDPKKSLIPYDIFMEAAKMIFCSRGLDFHKVTDYFDEKFKIKS